MIFNKLLETVIQHINERFELKDLGEVSNYLGNKIDRSGNGEFYVNQTSYIEEIVKVAGQENSKSSFIPIDIGYYKLKDDEPFEDQERYQKLIGMLLYVTTNSRPDIAASVSLLSQKVSKPSRKDWTELIRLIRYLKTTKDLKLKLSGVKSDLVIYSDANWGEDRTDRKSNTDYYIGVNGGTVSWCSRKQNLVTLSSCEAEYVALCETAKELVWIQNLMKDFCQECKSAFINKYR